MRADSYVRAAFEQLIESAKETEPWYVSLVVQVPYYGGPEEGGWWGSDTHVVLYQDFPSEESANAAAEAVRKLAEELSAKAHREYGEQCLREMEWLEARGLDADYLREPDGEEEYYVLVSRGIPQERRGCRHYE